MSEKHPAAQSRPSSCCGWRSATSRTVAPPREPRRPALPRTRERPRAASSKDRSPTTGSRPSPSSPPPTPTASTPTSDKPTYTKTLTGSASASMRSCRPARSRRRKTSSCAREESSRSSCGRQGRLALGHRGALQMVDPTMTRPRPVSVPAGSPWELPSPYGAHPYDFGHLPINTQTNDHVS